MRSRVRLAVVIALALGLAAGASAQKRQLPKRIVWWDDPMIVEQIGLTDDQRARMNEVFSRYQDALDPRRYTAVSQKPYLDALERGDWEQARADADRWIESLQGPKRAMAELKLQVLPILSAEQRGKLIQHYPRVIRRSWSPSPRWTDEPGGRGEAPPPRAKPGPNP